MQSAATTLLLERISQHSGALSAAELRVATMLSEAVHRIGFLSAAEVARSASVSEATVVRAAQALGFAGFSDLKRSIDTAASDPGLGERLRATLDRTAVNLSTIASVIDAHLVALAQLATLADSPEFELAVDHLAAARQVVLVGTGPSAAIAGYAAILFGRIGHPARAMSHTGASAADEICLIRPGDVVVALAYTRLHDHIDVMLRHCATLEVPVVLCTDLAQLPSTQPVAVMLRSSRGLPGRYSSHAATALLFESLTLAVAARQPDEAAASLDDVNRLRAELSGRRIDVDRLVEPRHERSD